MADTQRRLWYRGTGAEFRRIPLMREAQAEMDEYTASLERECAEERVERERQENELRARARAAIEAYAAKKREEAAQRELFQARMWSLLWAFAGLAMLVGVIAYVAQFVEEVWHGR
jgi:hypothetical protein